MKSLTKAALVVSSTLLALSLLDRYLLNPRPLTTVGKFTLLVLAIFVGFSALSAFALRTRLAAATVNAWLVLVSSAVAYILVDVIGGIIVIGALSPAIVRDDHFHHRLEPGKTSTVETYDFVYTQKVNDLGLRGAPIATPKPAGTYRILMLGDSFTMGYGVAEDETFSVLIQQSLNKKASNGTHSRVVEVLNGGVDSYAPILEHLQLVELAPVLEPDLVVLNIDMSDLIQEQAYRALATRNEAGEIVAVRAPEKKKGPANWGSALKRAVNNHLLVTRLVMFSLREKEERAFTVQNTVVNPNYELLRHTLASDTTNRDQQWNDLFDSVLAMKRYADERGIELVLSIYPWGHQVNDSAWEQGRVRFVRPGSTVSDASRYRIAAFARAQGLRLVDMFPAFREYKGPESLYYSFDMHWTAAGHRIAAAEIEAVVTDAISHAQEPSSAQ